MNEKVFRVGGDLLNVEADEIVSALKNPPWSLRKKSDDELRIEGSNVSFEIHSTNRGTIKGYDFLASGKIVGTFEETKAIITSIAEKLETCGIVYNFEAVDASDPAIEFVARHSRF